MSSKSSPVIKGLQAAMQIQLIRQSLRTRQSMEQQLPARSRLRQDLAVVHQNQNGSRQ